MNRQLESNAELVIQVRGRTAPLCSLRTVRPVSISPFPFPSHMRRHFSTEARRLLLSLRSDTSPAKFGRAETVAPECGKRKQVPSFMTWLLVARWKPAHSMASLLGRLSLSLPFPSLLPRAFRALRRPRHLFSHLGLTHSLHSGVCRRRTQSLASFHYECEGRASPGKGQREDHRRTLERAPQSCERLHAKP